MATPSEVPVQRSMVAHLVLQKGPRGGSSFVYWWYDGKGTRWERKRFAKREQVIRAVRTAGFGRYEWQGKVIPL